MTVARSGASSTFASPGCDGSLPPDGVFFTVKALFARFAAAARSLSKVMVSAVPLTDAEENPGAASSSFTVTPAEAVAPKR